MTTSPALRGAQLYALLRPIAAEARKRCSSRHARLGVGSSECADAADFVAISESCAFEAHRTFVRQLPRTVPFDWDLHGEAVIERTRLMLAAELEGGQTNYGEWRMRQPHRRRGITAAQPHAWTAWRRGVAERQISPLRHTTDVQPMDGPNPADLSEHFEAPPETDLEQSLDAELVAELKRVLTPLQYHVTVARLGAATASVA